MKHYIAVSLCAAIVVVMSPFAARSQNNQGSNVNTNLAQRDAAMMVPAHATLRTKLRATLHRPNPRRNACDIGTSIGR